MATQGGSREQHAEAGRQSHKNTDDNRASGSENNEEHPGKGWHGDPEGHSEAAKKGAEHRNISDEARERMSEGGRKGGQNSHGGNDSEDENDSDNASGGRRNISDESREKMAEGGRKGGQNSH